MNYSIEVHRTHVLVKGPLPLSHYEAVARLAPRDAVMDPDLAQRLGASVCFAAVGSLPQLRAEAPARPLPHGAEKLSDGARRWIQYGEHGLSSIALFVAATGVRQLLSDDQPQTRIAYPRDADDFRRCHAVYLEVPEVRNAMGTIAQLSIPWGKVVSAWTELARLLSDDPVALGWRLAEFGQAKHR